MSHRQTATEKTVQAHAVGLAPGQPVRAGDMVSVRPRHVTTHDNTGAVIPKFRSIGARRVADARQAVFTLDHNVQDTGAENRAKYDKIEAFAREHQLMMEVDFARSLARWGGKDYALSPMGPAAQELILAGGLEPLVARKIG